MNAEKFYELHRKEKISVDYEFQTNDKIFVNKENVIMLMQNYHKHKLKKSRLTKKMCKDEADKRYGGASFGNDRNIFLEGALWVLKKLNKKTK
jgi:hypothetical protein